MQRLEITPSDRDHWLRLRTEDVTSTETSALFYLSPYSTAFELWHQKKNREIVEIQQTERMELGLAMEPVIVKVFSKRYGVKVRALNKYIRLPHARMGASFDYEVVGLRDDWEGKDATFRELYREHGPGILEAKNVDLFIHRNQWDADDQPVPTHIEIQVQHQLEVMQTRNWAVITPLVGGNQLLALPVMRDPKFGEALREKVVEFWSTIDRDEEPSPIMPDDADAVIALYQHAEPGKVADLRDNPTVTSLLQEYNFASELAKQADLQKRTARARLMEIVGDAEKVIADGYKVSAGIVAPTEIPAYTRKGYRSFRVTKAKPKKD
jgi:putative phage-type endonuclease